MTKTKQSELGLAQPNEKLLNDLNQNLFTELSDPRFARLNLEGEYEGITKVCIPDAPNKEAYHFFFRRTSEGGVRFLDQALLASKHPSRNGSTKEILTLVPIKSELNAEGLQKNISLVAELKQKLPTDEKLVLEHSTMMIHDNHQPLGLAARRLHPSAQKMATLLQSSTGASEVFK